MTTGNGNKLKKLLEVHTPGTVCLASWLEAQGLSHDLQKHYRRSGWLESIGRGAFKRPGDTVGWEGALYALQKQAGMRVHVGGRTALTKQGSNQYIRLGGDKVYLYSPLGEKLPPWFSNYQWGVQIEHVKTAFLPVELGVGEVEDMGYGSPVSPFNLRISDAERAIMECLYLTPRKQGLVEVYEMMEGLVNLRPKVVQQLLEQCSSVKVKRLFLFMAAKISHKWLQFLDMSKINLGKGDRSIVPNGVYVSKFRISVPRELVDK